MSSLYRQCTCMRDMMMVVLGVCTDAKHEVSTLSRIISEGIRRMSHIKVSLYLYCMTLTGILAPLPALGSMTENFIVHPSVALMCSYLNVGVYL